MSRPTNVTPGTPLSPRERQVLLGIAHGLTNDQIAAELSVSDSTVRLFAKLGAGGRAHAVALAFVRGDLVVREGEVALCSP